MPEKTNATACPICGGATTNATLKAGDRDAQVVIAGKPDGFLGVIPYTTSPVSVRVCTHCGYIALFAQNLQDVLPMNASDTDDDE